MIQVKGIFGCEQPAPVPEITRDGLVAEYTMDSFSGTTLLNTSESGTVYNGTIGTGVSFATGKVGNCAIFPKTVAGRITFNSVVTPMGAKTISGWINITSGTMGDRLISNMKENGGGVEIVIVSGTSVRFDFVIVWPTAAAITVSYTPNMWNYFCLIWDGTKNANGVKLLFNSTWHYATFPGSEVQPSSNFTLGGRADSSNLGNCKIDQLRIYNRALTEDEVLLLATEPNKMQVELIKTVIDMQAALNLLGVEPEEADDE